MFNNTYATLSSLDWQSINWSGWFQFGALVFTLFWLIRYTRATEKMLENQMMPAVDVNMLFDNNNKKTFYWFSNASNIPAHVLIEPTVNGVKRDKLGPLRISPDHRHLYQFKKTSSSIDFLDAPSRDKTEVVLKISVSSALDNSEAKLSYTKSYKFNEPESRWDESSWGYPDASFPTN